MPTAYTQKVQDGTITEFSDFALDCARAFGALVALRDEPGAEIPDRFEPSDHHFRQAEVAKAELSRLQGLSKHDAEKEMTREIQKWRDRRTQTAHDLDMYRKRYGDMLDRVHRWTPPTKDHEELKKFMIEQLSESIKFDCREYIPPRPISQCDKWLSDKIEQAERSRDYHEREYLKGVERAAERTRWLKALRESLTTEEAC